jgi:hypothetical protein
MKMSDVFKVDRDIDIDDCDLFNLDEMGAAAHAINKHDALVTMNAELVKALDHTNQVLYNTIKLWNSSRSNQNDPLDYELCNENQVLIHKAKELNRG